MSEAERSRFQSESGQLIVTELGAGAHATVYATLDKTQADQFLTRYRMAGRNPEKQRAFFDYVRAHISAAKVGRVDWNCLNADSKAIEFRNEIETLQYFAEVFVKKNRKSFMQRITRATGEPAYTMEMLTGGTLVDMRTNFYKRETILDTTIPAGLTWHILASVLETLQFLHFGVIDGKVSGDPKLFSHNDLHGNNILFRYPGKFGNFPDVVIVDYGMSRSTTERLAGNPFWRDQLQDLQQFLHTLITLIDKADGDRRNFDLAFNLMNGTVVTDRNNQLKEVMQTVVAFAKRQRDKRYVPLSKPWVDYFSRPAVSDAELQRFFQDLKVKKILTTCGC